MGIGGCGELRLHHCTPAWPQSETPQTEKITGAKYMWWLMPVIPEFWEAKVGGQLELKS